MEQKARLRYLLNKLTTHTASEKELKELLEWVSRKEDLMPEIESLLQDSRLPTARYDKDRWMRVAEKILAADKTGSTEERHAVVRSLRPGVFYRYWWAAAVTVGVLVTAGLIWFQNTGNTGTAGSEKSIVSENIAPGKEGAILTLADGRKIVLDNLDNGIIAAEAGARVVLQDGRLIYNAALEGDSIAAYNTMVTPKGRQFSVTLPDGTRIWLNAASSLRYPTVFTGRERKVEVTGEAYFEIAQDARSPFFVKVNDGMEIEVLGTRFNVNAYAGEPGIKTTLIEGSVRLRENENHVLLSPGQQARIEVSGSGSAPAHRPISVINMKDAEIDKVMAWKKGIFNFDGASLDEVMRQLERWYDIEVTYEKGIPDIEFGGEMSRNVKLADLLRVLKASEVNFRIEKGRKLIVYP